MVIEGEEHLRAGIEPFWEDFGGGKLDNDKGRGNFVLGGRGGVGMQ